MNKLFFSLCLMSLCSDVCSQHHPNDAIMSIDEKFIIGVRNYAENKWADVIYYIRYIEKKERGNGMLVESNVYI